MSEKPVVWMISDLFHPEETSTGHYLKHICLGLRDFASVKVLCGQPRYDRRGHTVARYENYQGIHIWRCRGTTLDKNVLLFRMINVGTIMMSMMWNTLIKVRKQDVVVVTTNPPTLPVFLAPILWLKRARSILLIHDVYPDTLVASQLLPSSSPVVRLWHAINRRVFAQSSRIIAIGRDMAGLITSRMTAPRQGQVRVVPNWADTDEVYPQAREQHAILTQLGLSDKFVIQYAGNMGPMHDIGLLVEAARRLQTIAPNVHFAFFGRGKKRTLLERAVERDGIANISLHDPFPRAKQSDFLSACDISIIPFMPGMTGVGVPSRMYNVLAAGRPLITVAEDHSEIALVIRENQSGWVVAPGDVEGLVAAVLEAQSNHEQNKAMGKRSRAAADGQYSLQHINPQYSNVIREVTLGA